MAYHVAWSRKIKNDAKYWKQRKPNTGDSFLRSWKSWKTNRGDGETAWWLAARGLEEKGYWSPKASVTWRKSERAIENEPWKRLRHWDSHFLNQRGGVDIPGFSPLFSLWSLVGTSHSPNPSEISWHRAGKHSLQGLLSAPSPASEIFSEAWMHLNANEVKAQTIFANQHISCISKCQMLSNQKYLLTTNSFPHFSFPNHKE